jgi:oxygen-independent coproporphyrinogen-3 oxidase
MNVQPDIALIRKYNKPVPRYTSYPTVPYWKNDLQTGQWDQLVGDTFARTNHITGISLYIHLPFCESLCTYCGCNKKITTNHDVEKAYIDAVVKEWQLYRKLMRQTPVIREIHLGGGTPTFFSPSNLSKLIQAVTKNTLVHPGAQFSLEGHPNNTTVEHLQTLARLGFRRVSFGVQDNDPEVQRVINRVQPLRNVEQATTSARANGFQSVNFDLIYGLPRKNEESIRRTVRDVLELRPDRIAFYSYAHVPWTSKGQRLFDEGDLPGAEQKLRLYQAGKELFLEAGYTDIGMDHFALPDDELYQAFVSGRLHRNFMGYTTHETGILIGLGVSAISDLGIAFGQNEKTIQGYYRSIENGAIPIHKGTLLTDADNIVRRYILDVSCKGKTSLRDNDIPALGATIQRLEELRSDGLIDFDGVDVQLTDVGHSFVRNVCAAFDQYLIQNDLTNMIFSKAV